MQLIHSEFIYEHASFPSCHASTLIETPAGLMAAWFGGTDEGEPDVSIWLAHRRLAGWTNPVEVAHGRQPDDTRQPCWNPVLWRAPNGSVMLFYKVGPSPRAWWGMLMTSADDGRTWTTPARLPDGHLWPDQEQAGADWRCVAVRFQRGTCRLYRAHGARFKISQILETREVYNSHGSARRHSTTSRNSAQFSRRSCIGRMALRSCAAPSRAWSASAGRRTMGKHGGRCRPPHCQTPTAASMQSCCMMAAPCSSTTR